MTLFDDYLAAVNRQAEEVFDYRTKTELPLEDPVFLRSNDDDKHPIGWAIPNILSEQECDDLIEKAEAFGLQAPLKPTLRSSKRTGFYHNDDLSDLVFDRIKDQLDKNPTDKADYGPTRCIHNNWRVVRYDVGDQFPAHQDQMDSYQVKNATDGTKDFIVSSHTLLINLSPDGSVEGGATRFYPKTKNSDSPYGYAVDVYLPRGWGFVFRQKGLYHAGQPVLKPNESVTEGESKEGTTTTIGSKYIAQAGVMRVLPDGKYLRPSIFKNGPGLDIPAPEQGKGLSPEELEKLEAPERAAALPAYLL